MRIITYSTAVAIWLLSSICAFSQDKRDVDAQTEYLKEKIVRIQEEEKMPLKRRLWISIANWMMAILLKNRPSN